MIWDSHMHTAFSGDSDSPLNDMISAARILGLPGITVTDHLDLCYPPDPELFLLDLESYDIAVREVITSSGASEGTLSAGSQGQPFQVRYGIELGLSPEIGDALTSVISRFSYDFVIGSSHIVHGKDPYYPDYYEGRSTRDANEEYFASILENIRAWDGFDVYGHLDYVVRYAPEGSPAYQWTDYSDLIDEILKELIARDKGIELNTAGFKYGLSHPNPTEGILKRYRGLGGEIITVGADAHQPAHIAWAFDRVPAILKNAGFTHYAVYKNREPEFYPIP